LQQIKSAATLLVDLGVKLVMKEIGMRLLMIKIVSLPTFQPGWCSGEVLPQTRHYRFDIVGSPMRID